MHHNITIGLVEDQKLFREGVRAILNNEGNFKVIFESENGYSVIDSLSTTDKVPDVMLVDLSLPSDGYREYSGLDLTRELRYTFPDIAILILSVNDDPYFISVLIEAGASGYLSKDCNPDELYEAVRQAYTNGSYINERALNAIQGRLRGTVKANKTTESLSSREIDVLKLVCQQMTTEEIGEKLFISPKTVNGHRNHLLQKTDSRNVTGLVLYAIKHKIVEIV